MGSPRQSREKRVTISPAATPPSRAQIKSQKTPKLNEFRGRQSQSRRISETGFRSRSIRIAVARRRSRSPENPSAKSVRTGCPSSPSSSPARGPCWPHGQPVKNGGASSTGLELSSITNIRPMAHLHPTREVSHTSRPRASADPLGTSARFWRSPGDHRAARGVLLSSRVGVLRPSRVRRTCHARCLSGR